MPVVWCGAADITPFWRPALALSGSIKGYPRVLTCAGIGDGIPMRTLTTDLPFDPPPVLLMPSSYSSSAVGEPT